MAAAAYDVTGATASGIQYDKNGNIERLYRKDQKGAWKERLYYDYNSNSNQLRAVSSAGSFPSWADDFAYDANGNMEQDNRKGISAIQYNYLNLPESISMGSGTVSYIYNANGQKLRHVTASGKVTDYVGGFVYEDGLLSYLLSGEGRVLLSSGTEECEYHLKDHLGNTRVVFRDANRDGILTAATEVSQVSDYYPGGMEMPGRVVGTDYRFGYQGQFAEKDEETGYNQFEARLYDNRIGRWMSPDPYGQHWSPYLAMGNSPILIVDPNGGIGGPVQPSISDFFSNGRSPRSSAAAFANLGKFYGYQTTNYKTRDGRWIASVGSFALDFGSTYASRVFSTDNAKNWNNYLFGTGNTGRFAYETNIQVNLTLGVVGFTAGISINEANDGLGLSANFGYTEGLDLPNVDIMSLKHTSNTDAPINLEHLRGTATNYNASTSILAITSGGNTNSLDVHFKGLGATYTTQGSGLNLGFNDFSAGGTIAHTKTDVSPLIIKAR